MWRTNKQKKVSELPHQLWQFCLQKANTKLLRSTYRKRCWTKELEKSAQKSPRCRRLMLTHMPLPLQQPFKAIWRILTIWKKPCLTNCKRKIVIVSQKFYIVETSHIMYCSGKCVSWQLICRPCKTTSCLDGVHQKLQLLNKLLIY